MTTYKGGNFVHERKLMEELWNYNPKYTEITVISGWFWYFENEQEWTDEKNRIDIKIETDKKIEEELRIKKLAQLAQSAQNANRSQKHQRNNKNAPNNKNINKNINHNNKNVNNDSRLQHKSQNPRSSMLKTKFCNTFLKKISCKIKNCKFAHNVNELNPVMCKFDRRCNKQIDECEYKHSNESKEQYIRRKFGNIYLQ